jgi:two-component system sensor histidine kinase HupT/HoxJ
MRSYLQNSNTGREPRNLVAETAADRDKEGEDHNHAIAHRRHEPGGLFNDIHRISPFPIDGLRVLSLPERNLSRDLIESEQESGPRPVDEGNREAATSLRPAPEHPVEEATPSSISQEAAWLEVIRKVDEAYADLVRYQVEMDEKNTALEEAQRFIASVLTSMTDVLIVCDVHGRIEQVNDALERLTGRSAEELHLRPFQDLFASDCQPTVDRFPEMIRRHAIYDCELTLKGKDEEMPLAVNCTSRYDHKNRLAGMVLIGRPVGELRRAYEALNRAHAELKQAQQQLVRAEKLASLGRLVAGVAHELNNPISFVYGNVHTLKRYGERLQSYLDAVHAGVPRGELEAMRGELHVDRLLADLKSLTEGTLEGAERVRDIVQELRQFSSGQKGERTLCNLAHLARTAVQWVAKGSKLPIETRFELPEDLPVECNPGQIQQVLMNLVQNALDAMESAGGGQIAISGGNESGGVWLSLRDTGPGLSAEDLVRVFDPFFTTKPVGKGTGLGLSISYSIVAEHGGHLEVDNHAEGGALFTLHLPSTRPAGERA